MCRVDVELIFLGERNYLEAILANPKNVTGLQLSILVYQCDLCQFYIVNSIILYVNPYKLVYSPLYSAKKIA